MRDVPLLSILSSLIVFLRAAAAAADAEPARPADGFVDFVGVNTHLGYYDTTYRDYESILKPRLLELGVRHIRDGTYNDDVLRKDPLTGPARHPAPFHHGLKTGGRTGAKTRADALRD